MPAVNRRFLAKIEKRIARIPPPYNPSHWPADSLDHGARRLGLIRRVLASLCSKCAGIPLSNARWTLKLRPHFGQVPSNPASRLPRSAAWLAVVGLACAPVPLGKAHISGHWPTSRLTIVSR